MIQLPRKLGMVLVRLALGMAIVLLIYSVLIGLSESAMSYVSLHALLAFLSVLTAAIIYLVAHRERNLSTFIFLLALFWRGMIHFAITALFSFVEPDFTPSFAPIRAFMELLSLMILSILILLALITANLKWENKPRWELGMPFLILLITFNTYLYYVVVPTMDISWLRVGSFILAIIAIAVLVISIYLSIRNRDRFYDVRYFVSGQSVFILVVVVFLLYAQGDANLWILAAITEAFAYILLFVALGKYLYGNARISRDATRAILGFLLSLATIPFVLSLVFEAYATGVEIIDTGAYLVSHGAAALLSGMMTILLFVYFRKRPAWNLLPLIVLYLSWTYIYIIIMPGYQRFGVADLGESLLPYSVGALVSLVVIFRAVRYIRNPPDVNPTDIERDWIIRRFLAIAAGLVLALILENKYGSLSHSVEKMVVERVVLLTLNLLALFGFSILIFITAREYGDWKSIDVIAILILAFYIMPGILKGIYPDWTPGWWFGEMFLIVGLGVGPPLLGALYVDSMSKAQEIQRKATLYADLLVHDITNMHQAIMVALSLMEDDMDRSHTHYDTMQDAKASLHRAAEIVASVRQIGIADETAPVDLERKDIVEAVLNAHEQVKSEYPHDTINFTVNKEIGQCYTHANSLLIDLFYNLLRNSAKYSNGEIKIDVRISKRDDEEGQFWVVRIEDYGRGIDDERKKMLFRRYMKGAEGVGLGLAVVYALTKSYGGTIAVEDRIPGSYRAGSAFVVMLPDASSPLNNWT